MTSNYELLALLHERLQPRGYLEIGVRYGDSLRLAKCPRIGVDPDPNATGPGVIYTMTSDDFFARAHGTGAMERFDMDLVYIDGMHLWEYALRDFINVAQWANERTVVVFDDTHPYSQAIATRQQLPGDWTGDVWKAMDMIDNAANLDLRRAQVDVSPTGAYVVWGFDGEYSQGRQIKEALAPLVNGNAALFDDIDVPVDILERHHTITPEELLSDYL